MKINTFWFVAIIIAVGVIGWTAKSLADKNRAAKLLAAGGGAGDGSTDTAEITGSVTMSGA